MGIGASIFLIALGAILAFAVNVDLGGLDINVIGWILMVVGVLGFVMTAIIWGRRRTTVVESAPVEERRVVTQQPVEYRQRPVEYQRVEERRPDVDPPL